MITYEPFELYVTLHQASVYCIAIIAVENVQSIELNLFFLLHRTYNFSYQDLEFLQ